MATRKAYAISDNGKLVMMFANKEIRDLFISNVSGYKVSTCDEYRKVERMGKDKVDEWGNVVRYSKYNALDMAIPEFWDGWDDVVDIAEAKGIRAW